MEMSSDGLWDDVGGAGGKWCEEDTTFGLELDGDDGLWTKGFLPPPPRPHFLEASTQPDGLTTCDLCSWAAQQTFSSQDGFSFVPWPSTLVVVSILSALVGATLMVSFRRCFKGFRENNVTRYTASRGSSGRGSNGNKELEGERRVNRTAATSSGTAPSDINGLWCWISRRNQPAPVLRNDLLQVASNHYTVEEAYSGGGEALYAELDKPVYQNTGYVLDGDTNSPPSSAYYSDLSDRTYETVGSQQVAQWELLHQTALRHPLTAIAETAPVHSDYV